LHSIGAASAAPFFCASKIRDSLIELIAVHHMNGVGVL
jgi:hypothetical protein